MKPQEMKNKLSQLEKAVIRRKDNDVKTKYQVASMFRYINKLIDYQIPTPPINVSEDGHHFECAKCHTKFASDDDHVDDFYLCYICGQRWKEEDKDGN